MSEQDWAPEPWDYVTDYKIHVPFGLRAADGVPIFKLDDKLGPIITDADGERIAACVSACADVPTEVLENPNFQTMCQIVVQIAMIGKASRKKEASHD